MLSSMCSKLHVGSMQCQIERYLSCRIPCDTYRPTAADHRGSEVVDEMGRIPDPQNIAAKSGALGERLPHVIMLPAQQLKAAALVRGRLALAVLHAPVAPVAGARLLAHAAPRARHAPPPQLLAPAGLPRPWASARIKRLVTANDISSEVACGQSSPAPPPRNANSGRHHAPNKRSSYGVQLRSVQPVLGTCTLRKPQAPACTKHHVR